MTDEWRIHSAGGRLLIDYISETQGEPLGVLKMTSIWTLDKLLQQPIRQKYDIENKSKQKEKNEKQNIKLFSVDIVTIVN